MQDILGWIGTALILYSFTLNNIKRLRIVNSIGSIMWIGYGLQMGIKPIPEDNIRVKYLDREDIESLGFKYMGSSVDLWFEKEGTFEIGNWTSYKNIDIFRA
jgi:hypothetical protein